MNPTDPKIPEADIAARAHHIWNQRGRVEGESMEHWALACEELANEQRESARAEAVARPVTPERPLDRGGTS